MPWDKDAEAFTKNEKNMLDLTVDRIAHQQLAAVLDIYSADELRLLFIPKEHRDPLTLSFALHSVEMTHSEIWLRINNLISNPTTSIFGDARALPRATQLYVHFDRNTLANGFTTPTPICGASARPIETLPGNPPAELRERFISMLDMMHHIAGEWATVKWVLRQLNRELRTPPQVRYHWPALATLATAARLPIAPRLQQASVRAGTNSSVPSYLRPYLLPTYEVVSNAVLMKNNSDEVARYRVGQMRFYGALFEINGEGGPELINCD